MQTALPTIGLIEAMENGHIAELANTTKAYFDREVATIYRRQQGSWQPFKTMSKIEVAPQVLRIYDRKGNVIYDKMILV